MNKLIPRLCVSALFVMMFIGCKPPDPKQRVVGIWKHEDDAVVFRFFKDGTYVFYDSTGSSTIGTFSFPDDGHIKLDNSTIRKFRIRDDNKRFWYYPEGELMGTAFLRLNENDLITFTPNNEKRAHDL